MLPAKQFKSAERYLGQAVPKELATCRAIKMTKSCKGGPGENQRISGLEGCRSETRCQPGFFAE